MNRASCFRCFILGLTTLLVVTARAEEYQLQIVAMSDELQSDDGSTNRAFGPAKLNNAGEVLFNAGWRDKNTWQHSTLNIGRPGSVRRVATGGEAPPGSEGELFEGGVNRRTANFGRYQFNADGEILFTGTVYSPNSTIVPSYWHGLWKGTAGSYSLLTGAPGTPFAAKTPPTPGVTVPTYSGSGRLQFSVSEFHPLGVSDLGPGYFGADIDVLEGPPGGFQQWRNVVKSGTLTASFGRRLLFYNGGPAPGLGGDYVFFDTGGLILGQMGQRNGALVMTSTVHPRDAVQPTASLRKVFYEHQSDFFRPFYIETDPLPGLPPLSELLGVTQPYDLRARVEAVDEMGNCVLYVTASARTFIDVRQIGYWKKTAAGLAKVLQFNVDASTGVNSTARFGTTATNVTQRVAMGGGNIAWVGSVTRPGSSAATLAIIREVDNRFEVVAIADLPVPGTPWVLSNDFAAVNLPIRMNAAGEILFSASFREPPSTQLRRAIWAYGRDLVLRRVAFVGQEIAIGGAMRTISNVEIEHPSVANVFNDSGVAVFKVTFQGGTSGILRAVPPGYQDPEPRGPQGPDYWFNGRVGNNWHSSAPTNWENFAKQPNTQPPGDADAGTAIVFIPPQYSVMLNQRAASIGSLDAEGDLTLQHLLTLNYSSRFRKNLVATGPIGGLRLNNSAVNAETTTWNGGTLTLANSTFRNQNRFVATTGTVAHGGGTSTFENRGIFEKQGTGVFTLQVPFHAPSQSEIGAGGLRVNAGTLSLLGGGRFEEGVHRIAEGALVQLAGKVQISGITTFVSLAPEQRAGSLDLGSAQQDVNLAIAPSSRLVLQLDRQPTFFRRGEISGNEGSMVNHGVMIWQAGRIALDGRFIGFINHRRVEIDAAPGSRRLGGSFVNARLTSLFSPVEGAPATVVQRGSLEVDGVIENSDIWRIARSVDFTDSSGNGRFINLGTTVVHLEEPGEVNFDIPFGPPPLDSIEETNARYGFKEVFNVGSEYSDARELGSLHRRAVVRFRRYVTGLEAGWLERGNWVVESNGSLEFPQTINAIGSIARVVLRSGGEIPSLQLKENEGEFVVENMNYTIAGGLENYPGGKLRAINRATLTIDGKVTNDGTLHCAATAQIIVNGDLDSSSGFVENFGEIIVNGTLTLGEFKSDGKFRVPGSSAISFTEETWVGSSPGTLTIEGSAAFASTAALNMELAGTQPGTFDLLDVSGSLALGGRLRVSVIDNFQPAADNRFIIARAGTISGQFANAPSGQRVVTTDGRGTFQIFYGPGSPHGENNVVLVNWQLSTPGSPTVSEQPRTQTVGAGSPAHLTVTAGGAGILNYQWQYRGANIPGATGASYTVPSAQFMHVGAYSVVISNALGELVSNAAVLTVDAPPPSASRLLNVSTRALVRDGNEPLIPGFVLQGTNSARFLIRAVGPALNAFGVSGVLPNPQLTVKRLSGSSYVDHASNNDWGANANAAEVAAAAATVGAFPLPAGGLDSALLVDLAPGQYTVFADDVSHRGGVGIVEVYDLSGANASGRLTNISTRAFVGAGADIMIPGFVISNEGARTVLLRAVGPTLSSFGVSSVLADPQLTVYQRLPDGRDVAILSNDDWSTVQGAPETAMVAAKVGAFALPAGSKDAAMVATLSPGAYTVQVSGVGGTTGNALVEIYVAR